MKVIEETFSLTKDMSSFSGIIQSHDNTKKSAKKFLFYYGWFLDIDIVEYGNKQLPHNLCDISMRLSNRTRNIKLILELFGLIIVIPVGIVGAPQSRKLV